MGILLETNKLTKRYGKLTAVNQLDLKIEEGQVFGMLGPNGSGKTTTLGMVLGVTERSAGDFTWFGGENGPETRKKIGAILERPIFFPGYSAVENLKIVAKIKGISTKNMEQVLRMVQLYDRRNDRFGAYSLGMKQRLAIAAAMLCDPKALILDEPTNGLDPEGIAQIREIIVNIAGMGKSIILASHLLDEVQKVCSSCIILRKGELVFQGAVSADMGTSKRVEVDAPNQDLLREALQNTPFVLDLEVSKHGFLVSLEAGQDAFTLNKYLQDQGMVLSHLQTLKKSLEEQFLEIVNKS